MTFVVSDSVTLRKFILSLGAIDMSVGITSQGDGCIVEYLKKSNGKCVKKKCFVPLYGQFDPAKQLQDQEIYEGGIIEVMELPIAHDNESLRVKTQPNKISSKVLLFTVHFESGSSTVSQINQTRKASLTQSYDTQNKMTALDLQIVDDPEYEISGAEIEVIGAEYLDMIKAYIWHPSYGPNMSLGTLIESYNFHALPYQEHHLGDLVVPSISIPRGLMVRVAYYDVESSGKKIILRVIGWSQ